VIFRLAAPAIIIFVEPAGVALHQIGDDEARVGPLPRRRFPFRSPWSAHPWSARRTRRRSAAGSIRMKKDPTKAAGPGSEVNSESAAYADNGRPADGCLPVITVSVMTVGYK
jgi:hypothetical protein